MRFIHLGNTWINLEAIAQVRVKYLGDMTKDKERYLPIAEVRFIGIAMPQKLSACETSVLLAAIKVLEARDLGQ